MEEEKARKETTLAAEKQMSIVRALVIVFGTAVFFLLDEKSRTPAALWLILPIWLYGAFILFFKPYEKYPIFLASWFTYGSDCLFITLWIYATGGYISPYHVLYHTSIIAVAFRFGLKTTLFTCTLYTVTYILLLYFMDQLDGVEGKVLLRTGFIYIIGYTSHLITRETLVQTRQKHELRRLIEEAKSNQEKLRDMNEQQKVKNELLNLAEQSANLGSFLLDLESGELQYSDNLFRLIGHEPGAFVPTIEKFATFVHPSDRDEYKKKAEEVMRTGRMSEDTVYRLNTGDGVLRYVRATGKTSQSEGRNIIIGTLQDISSDIVMQNTLRAKNAELEQINSELSSFNYVASHDLQEPVRKILTFTELVMEKDSDRLSETAVNYLERVISAARRIQHLIRAFLHYSQINASQVPHEKVNLNEIMEEMKLYFAEKLEGKNGVITYSPLPEINGVKIQLQQLFINLIGNSIKYSRDDVNPVIHISSEVVNGIRMEEPGDGNHSSYLKITLTDNGIGFGPEYAEKIFDVFVRLHSKDKYEGTGIGLAICKKIVTNHHGYIRAESDGQGATFHIYLPVPED